MFNDFYSFLVQIYISLKSASMDAVNISGIFAFFFQLVVKRVLQKKQEFRGMDLIVKPYEENMKMDNHRYEVFHNWCRSIFLNSIKM